MKTSAWLKKGEGYHVARERRWQADRLKDLADVQEVIH